MCIVSSIINLMKNVDADHHEVLIETCLFDILSATTIKDLEINFRVITIYGNESKKTEGGGVENDPPHCLE